MNGWGKHLVRAGLLIASSALVTPAHASCLRMNESTDPWPELKAGRIQGVPTEPQFLAFRPFLLDAANDAFDYFRAEGFPAPSLCTLSPIKVDIHTASYGEYTPDTGQLNVGLSLSGALTDLLGIDATGVTASSELLDTVAHEVFHAVQHARAPLDMDASDDSLDWIIEGTATAVGVSVAEQSGGTKAGLGYWGTYGYDAPLHQPQLLFEQDRLTNSLSVSPFPINRLAPDQAPNAFFTAYSTNYRRGHFFYYMGEDIGSKDRIKWLATDYNAGVMDGAGGLRWLDTVLAHHGQNGLGDYFPRFIARHAGDLSVFSPIAAKAAPWVVNLEPGQEASRTVRVQAMAATPVSVDLGLTGDGGVYLVEQRLGINSQGWGHLVIDDQVIAKGQPYRRLISDGQESWFTRVVNVDRVSPWASQTQEASLTLTADPLLFDQGCLTRGQRFTPALPERSVQAVEEAIASGNMRWDIKGGKVLATATLEAPRTGQGPFEIALLERRGAKWQRHVVGRGVTSAGGCKVRLRVGQAILTYDPARDYSEFREEGRPEAIYLGQNGKLAIFESGNWMDLPPEVASAMRMAVVSSVGITGGPAALGRGDFEAGPHRIPHELWREFSWPALREASFGGKALSRKSVPCPTTGHGCTKANFNPVEGSLLGTTLNQIKASVIFDTGGMPVEVDFGAGTDEGKLHFAVGDFEMNIPPGW